LVLNKKDTLMKNTMIRSITLSAAVLLTATAFAHDPSEHMKKNEKPQCAGMDHSKMDMNDPVAQAMMKRCSMADHDMKKEGGHDMHSNMQNQKTMEMKAANHDEHQH